MGGGGGSASCWTPPNLVRSGKGASEALSCRRHVLKVQDEGPFIDPLGLVFLWRGWGRDFRGGWGGLHSPERAGPRWSPAWWAREVRFFVCFVNNITAIANLIPSAHVGWDSFCLSHINNLFI